jgi:sialidase-1
MTDAAFIQSASMVPAEPFLEQKDVFINGLDSVNWYRIPALITTQSGTVLAFCEARDGDDQTPTDLVMKRSYDNGKTWTPMQTVLVGKQPGTHAMMNPCPVVDRSDGTILLLCNAFPVLEVEGQYDQQFIPGAVRQLVLKSTDDGANWSEPVDITEQVSDPKTWSYLHIGPGICIQTSSGRLIGPWIHCRGDENLSGVIYSDDHGLTWQSGGYAPGPGSECQVVELVDGSLMLNIRSESYRDVSLSSDGGESWSDKTQDRTLVDPTCQGSILRHTKRSDGFDKDRLLFCNPADESRRANITVRLSYDEGKTWSISKTLREEPCAGYSCMTVLADGSIGLLYESGTYSSDTICFARFSLEWLTDGEDSLRR